ncbi:DNA polymerase IV [Streptomyces sp. CWNU-1]|uniref:DNA polymerase IV n=1 Tax=Streptomyces albipurpureus TaxID=2897419 RepID=A0ABT0UHP7_9ACTN|nr:DNA polymerase IV [Streptomyces sp. CWNU-1]
MDAFYAAVEQAAKPSLRGKPVIVGGLGPRGVVATASYEARRFGAHSAMPMAYARRLAPNAAYLVPRFSLYRAVSDQVMELLGRLSPLVEPLSLDEAFVDLEAGGTADDSRSARAAGESLRADILAATGLAGSVGLAGSKMLAKIASEQAKPNGLVLIEPGTERELLGPLSVRTLPGIGPATGEHLRRAGITICSELAAAGEDELVRLLGRAHGTSLHRMALGYDDRPVVAERDTKSVSVEDTFDVDLHDRIRIRTEVERLAERCVRRLRESGHSGRTIVLKVRRYDFSTLTRSETLRGPTDDTAVVREAAGRLLEGVETTGGVRLLGVGVTGLADYTQEDLFAQAATAREERELDRLGTASRGRRRESDPPSHESGHREHPVQRAPFERHEDAQRRPGLVPPDGQGARTGEGVLRPDGADRAGMRQEPSAAAPAAVEGVPPSVSPSADARTGADDSAARPGDGSSVGPGAAEPGGGPVPAAARAETPGEAEDPSPAAAEGLPAATLADRRWQAGHDVRHAEYGPGWVQGSGLGRVTVRFEQPGSPPGRVRTFWVDDPALAGAEPLPLVGVVPGEDGGGSTHRVPHGAQGARVPPSSRPATRPKERSAEDSAADGSDGVAGDSGAAESSSP